MAKLSNPDYLGKVKRLSKKEVERLLSRMSGKLPSRLDKNKISREEALAIQMELEDEQLQDWRKMMQDLRKKEAEKNAASKSKVDKKVKASKSSKGKAKGEPTLKAKTVKETKASPDSKVTKKIKVPSKTNISE